MGEVAKAAAESQIPGQTAHAQGINTCIRRIAGSNHKSNDRAMSPKIICSSEYQHLSPKEQMALGGKASRRSEVNRVHTSSKHDCHIYLKLPLQDRIEAAPCSYFATPTCYTWLEGYAVQMTCGSGVWMMQCGTPKSSSRSVYVTGRLCSPHGSCSAVIRRVPRRIHKPCISFFGPQQLGTAFWGIVRG